MIGEDLHIFFNPDEHAVPAALKTPTGEPLRTVNVIFAVPVEEFQVGVDEVAHQRPTFQCATADLEGVKKNYLAIIGGTTYKVVRRTNDGTGLTTAWLSKQ